MTQSDDATLDLATVLGEVVESARALIGARKGVIVTLDEAGAPQAPVFSGLTPEEERQQLAWPGNASLFVHLRSLPGPVRVADFPAYVSALGIESPWTISRTFQGMPMRHRGRERSAASPFPTRPAAKHSLPRTRKCWPWSPPRPPRRSPTRAPTRASGAPGPTSRLWSRPHRSGWWSSTRRAAGRCRSTARRGGSSSACARPAIRPSNSWR